MKIFNAQLESPNFSFSAYGKTEGLAIWWLKQGLIVHAKEYRLPSGWWEEFENDIFVTELCLGGCFRDGTKISIVV